MNAQFVLPEFFYFKPIYEKFLIISKDYPEILMPNTELYTLFGNFPGCIWNGGGISYGGNISSNQIKEVIEYYNYEWNMPLTFTFTNPLVEEKHYCDTYSNLIAEIGNNGENYILVSNLGLEEYLRKNYKNYKYCRSILASEKEPYLLNGPHGTYDVSVLKRRMNNNWDYLDNIPQEERNQIEFLCNDPCPDNCPRLYTHYKDFARAQLTFSEHVPGAQCSMTEIQGMFKHHYTQTKLQTYISRKMIDEEYLPRGFCKFKCSGRSSLFNSMFNVVNYLVKKEYRDDMIGHMLTAINIY